MKKSLSILFALLSISIYAQNFEIPPLKQPYYDIIEWKGIGALALSRDLTLTQKQVDLTMVSGDGKSAWQQVYNPMARETYFISEDGGKYAYFLENLELNDGKVFVHQLSAAGNIKVMNVNFLTQILGHEQGHLLSDNLLTRIAKHFFGRGIYGNDIGVLINNKNSSRNGFEKNIKDFLILIKPCIFIDFEQN